MRPSTPAEKAFCALGPVGEAFLKGAAAAGVTKLGVELEELAGLRTEVCDPYLELVQSRAYQELQPHQEAAIERARALLSRVR